MEGTVKAEAAAFRALELDADLAEAHVALGVLHGMKLRWLEADREYRRALELNPGYVTGRWVYGFGLIMAGKFEEGIAQLEIARELDPLAVCPTKWDLGWAYALNGEEEKAFAQWARMLELAPNYHATYQHLGNFQCQKGEFDEAATALERARSLSPADPHVAADLAYCYARAGRQAEARQLLISLQEAAKGAYLSPMVPALVYVGLGERDKALGSLEEAFASRANMIGSVGWDPRYDSLRSDPRFMDLLRRIGVGGASSGDLVSVAGARAQRS